MEHQNKKVSTGEKFRGSLKTISLHVERLPTHSFNKRIIWFQESVFNFKHLSPKIKQFETWRIFIDLL